MGLYQNRSNLIVFLLFCTVAVRQERWYGNFEGSFPFNVRLGYSFNCLDYVCFFVQSLGILAICQVCLYSDLIGNVNKKRVLLINYSPGHTTS